MSIANASLTGGTEQDQARTPAVSLLLAYAAMAPIVAAAAASLAGPRPVRPAALRLGNA